MHTLKLIIITMIAFLIIDGIWLGLIAKPWFFESYGPWLDVKDGQLQLVWWAAGIVYALMTIGIVFMALPLANGQLLNALLYGALFGLITYGMYDFTCLAVFKNWPVGMAFIDWAWGTFLCAITTFITAYSDKWLS